MGMKDGVLNHETIQLLPSSIDTAFLKKAGKSLTMLRKGSEMFMARIVMFDCKRLDLGVEQMLSNPLHHPL